MGGRSGQLPKQGRTRRTPEKQPCGPGNSTWPGDHNRHGGPESALPLATRLFVTIYALGLAFLLVRYHLPPLAVLLLAVAGLVWLPRKAIRDISWVLLGDTPKKLRRRTEKCLKLLTRKRKRRRR